MTGVMVWIILQIALHILVRPLDSQSRVLFLALKLSGYFWDRWSSLAGILSWYITTIRVNSALHPTGVAKSSTSFGWGERRENHCCLVAGNMACDFPLWCDLWLWTAISGFYRHKSKQMSSSSVTNRFCDNAGPFIQWDMQAIKIRF